MAKRVVGTVITKSFLAHARTLAETLTEHNPDVELYVLLADRLDNYFDPSAEPFHLIQLEDLPEFDVVSQMCFYYTPFELCCALRGYLHEYIFHHTSAESWMFLDADIMIFHSLDQIFQQIEQSSIVLTPHLQNLPTLPKNTNIEIIIITAGLYNAGFMGLKRSEETLKFITWFKERLQYYCFNDAAIEHARGLFVDQRWLDLVPLYFKAVSFLSNSGANLGHWNLYERQLDFDSHGKVVVNQEPLLFVHFSGWDISDPRRISKYNWLYEEQPMSSPWATLAECYRDKLLKNGYETTIQYSYAFSMFHDGTPITLPMRRAYYDEVVQGHAHEGSPFDLSNYLKDKIYIARSVQFIQAELEAEKHRSSQLQQSVEQLQRDYQSAQVRADEMRQKVEHTYAQLQHTEATLHSTQTELQHTEATLHSTQTELQHTEATLHSTQTELQHTEATLHSTQTELYYLHEIVRTMKKSTFWKLRTLWWNLKQKAGFPAVDILKPKPDDN
jgi:hypothetical protein